MTRRCGRARRGARLVAKVPQRRWRTLTFLAALRCDRIEAPCVIDGPINGISFRAYVEQFLVPTLGSGDIVIMDNLGSHKGHAVRQLIRNAGAKLFFLPRLLKTQNPAAQSRPAIDRNNMARDRRTPRQLHAPRMRQLPRQLWIRFGLTGSCSNCHVGAMKSQCRCRTSRRGSS